MSGILNNKSRVLDTIMTLEGRRQLALGKLRVSYASFSDASTFYEADVISGSSDASQRIYLEQCHLPQDQITFQVDETGNLNPFGNDSGLGMKNGQIISYSFEPLSSSILTGSSQVVTFLKGADFESAAQGLLTSSADNFNKLYIINTKDPIFEDDGFSLGNTDVEFVINDKRPISSVEKQLAHIDHLDSLFSDIRFTRVKNFHFLPPLNRVDDDQLNKKDYRATTKHQLANYRPWGRTQIEGLSPKQLEEELDHYDRMGYSRTIAVDPTSRDNRLMAQFFEISYSSMRKLDVIEYGSYPIAKGVIRTVFFVGKLMLDTKGSQTFIHLFTLVFG
jgi:hypothetical protein